MQDPFSGTVVFGGCGQGIFQTNCPGDCKSHLSLRTKDQVVRNEL